MKIVRLDSLGQWHRDEWVATVVPAHQAFMDALGPLLLAVKAAAGETALADEDKAAFLSYYSDAKSAFDAVYRAVSDSKIAVDELEMEDEQRSGSTPYVEQTIDGAIAAVHQYYDFLSVAGNQFVDRNIAIIAANPSKFSSDPALGRRLGEVQGTSRSDFEEADAAAKEMAALTTIGVYE